VSTAPFEGFAPDTLAFYADITAHNDRAWFESQRDRFAQSVLAPSKAFITTLGPRLAQLSPHTGFDPDHNGRGSFKKIHTDQRFQQGREPFKTSAQFIFWNGPLPQKKANAVYFVQIGPHEVVLAAGLKYFEGKLVKAFRDVVVHPVEGPRLAAAVQAVEAAGYTLEGTHYQNVPKGFPADHPNARLLKHDAIYASLHAPVPPALFTPGFVDWCLGHFAQMAPLFDWSVSFLHKAEPVL
jgi:uncharacterized protein (TIGR02453 family)